MKQISTDALVSTSLLYLFSSLMFSIGVGLVVSPAAGVFTGAFLTLVLAGMLTHYHFKKRKPEKTPY